ncbi:MAG: nucleotidyltransferase domain-containing protein [Anaerolineae bacterium]|nr:nucleotidyltransferase domain-containing protein [Anaerolineae bacterium]
MVAHLAVSPETIRDFCQRHQICRLSLFGSVLRDDFRPDSDIDVLVQFKAGVRYRLADLVQMGDELESIFGRPVDLLDRVAVERSPNYIRRKIIFDSERVVYEE